MNKSWLDTFWRETHIKAGKKKKETGPKITKMQLESEEQILEERVYAYATCFSELIQCKAINLEVSLEALLIHPWWQTCVFILCNTETEMFRGSKHTRTKKKKKRPLTFSTQPVYIKSKVEARIDAWMVRRSGCLPPVDSLGNKDRDTSCASIHRGLLNNDQKWLWQRVT